MTRQVSSCPLPPHLFASEDGCLYDCRDPNWSRLPPLRNNYRRHHRKISSVADLKATLRAGPYAWPGGYDLVLITEEGDELTFDAVRYELVNEIHSQWLRKRHGRGFGGIVACDLKATTSEDEIATEFEERSQ